MILSTGINSVDDMKDRLERLSQVQELESKTREWIINMVGNDNGMFILPTWMPMVTTLSIEDTESKLEALYIENDSNETNDVDGKKERPKKKSDRSGA